ncbi:MAG: formate--tetrahydrofolate ligase, partial [Saprospiraceae bacterium]|nr:formate--tetrahydrofolate ligase [Saprospiraceae bacterium]
GNIVVAYNSQRQPIRARDLNAHGAMAVLLKDAIKPNLVQTLEHTPAFIHGGPFANIAHGCNSVIATQSALKLADYVVTEAGFGADLGAEKFLDIKCRKAGLRPNAVVLVATLRALKYHGGASLEELNRENLDALAKGIVNVERHVKNIREVFGLPCVVGINHFTFDTAAEIALLQEKLAPYGVSVVVSKHWAEGGKGAEALAQAVVQSIENSENNFRFAYEDNLSLWDKMKAVATKIYGAADISADAAVRRQIKKLEEEGYGHYPVCVAKTQYSFSTDPKKLGAPSGHTVDIREVRLAAGAEFVVMICGAIMTMPGLPKAPSAEKIDLDETGKVVGLF